MYDLLGNVRLVINIIYNLDIMVPRWWILQEYLL
jgi:hypothetical protein